MNSEGEFLTYESLVSKYGDVCSKLSYMQLLSAIPSSWRLKVRKSPRQEDLGVCHPCIKNCKWLGQRKINSDMYHFVLCLQIVAHPYYFQAYWKNIFDTPLPWLNFFKNIYESSCLTYLWVFQLKIFYKILATRKMLKIWKITDDNTCRFCGDEEEDIMHLFWYCPDVARQVERAVRSQTGIHPLGQMEDLWRRERFPVPLFPLQPTLAATGRSLISAPEEERTLSAQSSWTTTTH